MLPHKHTYHSWDGRSLEDDEYGEPGLRFSDACYPYTFNFTDTRLVEGLAAYLIEQTEEYLSYIEDDDGEEEFYFGDHHHHLIN